MMRPVIRRHEAAKPDRCVLHHIARTLTLDLKRGNHRFKSAIEIASLEILRAMLRQTQEL
jgi:hypothetical protein